MSRLIGVPPGDDYIKRHGLDGLFNDLMNRLLQDRPENPIQYLITTLKETQEKNRCLQAMQLDVHGVDNGRTSLLSEKDGNTSMVYSSPSLPVSKSDVLEAKRTSMQPTATSQSSYSVSNEMGTKRMRRDPESVFPTSNTDNVTYHTKMAQAWSIHVDSGQLRVPKLTNFILTYSNAFGCPDEFFLLPLLSMTASLMGKNAECEVNPCWREPCILWSAVATRKGEETFMATKKLLGDLKVTQSKLPIQDQGQSLLGFRQGQSRKLFTNLSTLDKLHQVLSANQNQLLCFSQDLEILYEELNRKSNLEKKQFASLYDGDYLNDNMDEFELTTSLNFAGFMDSKSLVKHLSAECIDDLSANLLISCPAEKDILLEDLSTVTKEMPSFHDVFTLIQAVHSSNHVTYEFSEDALQIARSYLNALTVRKRELVFDENRRLVVAKARSQFVRLCMIVQVLNGAIEAAYNTAEMFLASMEVVDTQWHSSTITGDAATAAAYLTECYLLQKLSLMPEELKLNIDMHKISDNTPSPKISATQQEIPDSDEQVSLAYCRNRASHTALDPDVLEEYYESQYPKFPENCENNIRSFLIHDGECIHSSKVMQVHLMPPYDTPGPGRNRYAAPAAKFFMRKLTNLGLGKLFRKGNKGGLIFQKKKWEELDDKARSLVEKCGVTEWEYRTGKKPKTSSSNGDVSMVPRDSPDEESMIPVPVKCTEVKQVSAVM